MTATDLFDDAPPPPSNLPFWRPSMHENELLIFEVAYVDKDTKYMSDELVDHVFGTVFVVSGGDAGSEYQMRISNSKLVAQLRPKCGKRVAGRLVKRASRGGGNAAWVIDSDISEIDRKRVTDFLTAQNSLASEEPPF